MKYLPEIVLGLVLTVFLGYAVSCDRIPGGSAKVVAINQQINTYLKYLEASKRKYGNYPEQLETVTDPWNTPYFYTLINGAPRVCSLGPDKLPNTQDDICNR